MPVIRCNPRKEVRITYFGQELTGFSMHFEMILLGLLRNQGFYVFILKCFAIVERDTLPLEVYGRLRSLKIAVCWPSKVTVPSNHTVLFVFS